MNTVPRHNRAAISLIEPALPRHGAGLFAGGMEGAGDLDLLAAHGITTVVNCAVNLDLDYATSRFPETAGEALYGTGAVRYYKLGLIDGPGRGGRSRSMALVALFLHGEAPERYPTLDAALAHVRARRGLRSDEWFETPKPGLVAAARRAAGWVAPFDADVAG